MTRYKLSAEQRAFRRRIDVLFARNNVAPVQWATEEKITRQLKVIESIIAFRSETDYPENVKDYVATIAIDRIDDAEGLF